MPDFGERITLIPTITKKLEEDRIEREKQLEFEQRIKDIIDFQNSDFYKMREDTRHWREPAGVSAFKITPIIMEISYYSDLVCENSKYGNITATGEVLVDGMIANNKLPFGTRVYIEGEGMKVVKDRGSNKYFSSVNACDVFVPRQSGESDRKYYKRVNNMGRHYKQGYIIEEE